ncbi:flagellar basal body rod protein FlgC [Haematobacter massiliensis]|uniref:Flagellar basal body rod protein FlgB n=1 Tax=Haematobacter massiliensis TaxID=195105 RepID=A0A086Y8D2_9RHOB|nr:flagellar basal body rod protein FlgC [Haematobacter massiliensis]KFI30532.1 flagellar basal body rod protein FlgC [Haematobacter massiliensis]OWJ73380.1 flagellar basal body rod protein FlgC [Haematobacter massiliensis]OWJ82316.1 flagellar basal body rod protein FlgC [Haematobacter massiliensis]QBJ25001.1 flagellar basal body rod protein FlgC [Haematobacter massiliensis]
MADLKQILAVSSSGMEAQSGRLRNISQNIANADTPGYRRKTAAFEAEMRGAEAGQVHLSRTRLDRSELQRIHDPAHPMADASGYYDGSNVDLMVEIADAREAQRSYEANLRMFDQARQMTSAALDLLRR